MQDNQKLRYFKYAIGEVLLIIAGIFLALQLDNWNQTRKDRQEEQQILLGLRTEFEANQGGLQYRWDISIENVRRMHQFMSHLSQPDSQYTIADLDQGLFASMFAGTWDPTNSALEALISSGGLRLIQDPTLRTKLAGWSAVVDEVRDNQVTIRQHAAASLWSALAEHGAPSVRGWGWQHSELKAMLPEALGRRRYEDIRGRSEIVDLIAMKYTWTKHSVEEIEFAMSRVEEIIGLIDEQLE